MGPKHRARLSRLADRGAGSPRWQRRPRPLVGPLLGALVALALAAGAAATTAPATPVPAPSAASGETWVFRIAPDGRTLVPLDPASLDDLPTTPLLVGPPADLAAEDDRRLWHWRISAAGSTLVGVDLGWNQEAWTADDITFVVRDGLTGRERTRFHPPVLVVTDDVRLSDDGRRAVLRAGWVYGGGGGAVETEPQTWWAVDTTNGQVLATVTSDEQGPGLDSEQPFWIDPHGRRLYRLVVAPGAVAPGPRPTRLVANDLTTGEEIERLALPEVLAGGAVGPATDEQGLPVDAFVGPDLAVSADGGRLAIVAGDGATVTVIDAARLAVVGRHRLPASPADQPTAAPRFEMVEGRPFRTRVRGARFSAAGDALLLTGFETDVDDASGEMACRSVPLRRLDLVTGAMVDGPPVVASQPVAATAGGLFAVGEVAPGCVSGMDPPVALLRLDPTTLEPLASRELREAPAPAFVAVPAPPDAAPEEGS